MRGTTPAAHPKRGLGTPGVRGGELTLTPPAAPCRSPTLPVEASSLPTRRAQLFGVAWELRGLGAGREEVGTRSPRKLPFRGRGTRTRPAAVSGCTHRTGRGWGGDG